MDIITTTFPSFRNITVGWRLQDGRKALLPLVRTRAGRGGLLYGHHSTWPGVYGGIVSDGKLSCGELQSMYASIRHFRMASGYIVGNPFGDITPPNLGKTENTI